MEVEEEEEVEDRRLGTSSRPDAMATMQRVMTSSRGDDDDDDDDDDDEEEEVRERLANVALTHASTLTTDGNIGTSTRSRGTDDANEEEGEEVADVVVVLDDVSGAVSLRIAYDTRTTWLFTASRKASATASAHAWRIVVGVEEEEEVEEVEEEEEDDGEDEGDSELTIFAESAAFCANCTKWDASCKAFRGRASADEAPEEEDGDDDGEVAEIAGAK